MIDALLRATEELLSALEEPDTASVVRAESRREAAFQSFAENHPLPSAALTRLCELDARVLALARARQAEIRSELDGIGRLRGEQRRARSAAEPRFVSRRA